MNCPVTDCKNEVTRDYPVCHDHEDTRHFTGRPCRCESCKWLDYRDAAALMLRPEDYFRMKCSDGSYKHFPSIERWQPGGKGTRLYVRREHVEQWIAASKTPAAPAPVKHDFIGYESALPTLRRLGAKRTMRSLGLLK